MTGSFKFLMFFTTTNKKLVSIYLECSLIRTHVPAPTLGYMLWEPSALRSSVKLVGLVSWHGPVFNTSEVGPLGRTLGCFSKPVCGVFGIIVLLENPIVSESFEVFYSIQSVQCAGIDAASTVFDRRYRVLHCEGLRSLSHLDIKVCATANMSLA